MSARSLPISSLVVLVLSSLTFSACDSSDPESGLDDITEINYQLHVQPIFDAKCNTCHEGSRAASSNGLELTSWRRVFEGADEGESVVPYSSENSVLIEIVTKWDLGSHPGELNQESLSAEEIRFLRRWIDEGAKNSTGTVYGSDARNLLYVSNQADASVSVIDTDTGQVIRVVDLVSKGFSSDAKPHMVSVEPDGSAWYLSLIGDNKVVKFSRENELLGSADFEAPGMVAVLPGRNKLYVARSFSASNPPTSIGTINRDDMSIDLIDVVFDRPHALIADPSGNYVLTASLATNQITAIDAATDEVIGASGQPEPTAAYVQGATNFEGTILYMTGQLSNELTVYNLQDLSNIEKIATVETADQPWHPVVTRDDRFVYFGNQKSNNVYFVDTSDYSVGGAIGGRGISEPHGSATSMAGKVYISNRNTISRYTPRYDFGDNDMVGTVIEIDPATNEITRVIEVGRMATGIAATR